MFSRFRNLFRKRPDLGDYQTVLIPEYTDQGEYHLVSFKGPISVFHPVNYSDINTGPDSRPVVFDFRQANCELGAAAVIFSLCRDFTKESQERKIFFIGDDNLRHILRVTDIRDRLKFEVYSTLEQAIAPDTKPSFIRQRPAA